jgi:HPt (histidine-containing phosphotransfer) domain-containing protein
MPETDALHPEFADLWPGSLVRIDAALDRIAAGVEAVEAGALDEPVRAEARAGAHKLVGTLGTYGLARCAALARELELEFEGSPGDAAPLRERLDALTERVRAVPSTKGD